MLIYFVLQHLLAKSKFKKNNMNTFQVKVPMSLKYVSCLEASLLTWFFHMNIINLEIFIIVTLSPCS